MATTTSYQPGNDAFLVVVDNTSDDFFLQNIGPGTAVIVWAASLPAATAVGHPIQAGEAVVRGGYTGKVYARSLSGTATIVVTDEPAA